MTVFLYLSTYMMHLSIQMIPSSIQTAKAGVKEKGCGQPQVRRPIYRNIAFCNCDFLRRCNLFGNYCCVLSSFSHLFYKSILH